MTPRRRLATGLAVAAAVLLAGRAAALLFSDYTWYSELGATPLWRERLRSLVMLHTASAMLAGIVAFVNLSAVRRSIVSLAFPRRLGNVEFGEEVPRSVLDRAALVLSLAVAIVMSLVVPAWEKLAMVRLGIRFREIDPFFQRDISFYTSWIPLETAAYVWAITLLVLVGSLVIALYALTPGLRWHRGSFHVSVRVRRHLSVIAALFLLTMAWSYRLDGYELLMRGSGADGMFSYVDHQWLIPAYLSLSIGTVVASALVLLSGWTGQIRAGFFTISAVIIFAVALDLILPSVVRRLANVDVASTHQAPYEATRAAFTARAYGLARNTATPPAEVRRFTFLADSARLSKVVEAARDSALVYPGASGAALVRRGRNVAAPLIGGGMKRLAHAWSEQRLDLLWTPLTPDTRIAKIRDVRTRVSTLMPVFAQGSDVAPAYLGDSLVWVVELYSTSTTYPLSRHHNVAGADRSYFRHAGTGIINASTGRLVVVPVQSPDPIAASWRSRFPANIRPGSPDLLDELTPSPRLAPGIPVPIGIPATDSAFRAEVTRLFGRMRQALSSGDLAGFAAAYDSLGEVVGR
ncbi:MAG: UPF0182 family protein [Gemmatimonadaceae bacterium]